jgi:hypothetical protein
VFPYSSDFLWGGGGGKQSLLLALPLLCLALALAGCDHGVPDEGGVLTGNWKYSYEYEGKEYVTEIRITPAAVNYVDYYEGTIEKSPNFEAPYGVLIIRFTKYADTYGEEPSTSSTNVGSYGAMYWKNLSSNSVYLSDAGISTGTYPDVIYTHTMFATLPEAEAVFINEAVNTYANFSAPYTK